MVKSHRFNPKRFENVLTKSIKFEKRRVIRVSSREVKDIRFMEQVNLMFISKASI